MIRGNAVDGVPLKYSKEVAVGVSYKLIKRVGKEKTIFTSSETSQNFPTARVSKDKGRTLDKGIQLYRMWFNFLKLALELEEQEVSLVTKNHTWIKNTDNPNEPIPKNILQESTIMEGGSQSAGIGGRHAIFRCKRVQKIKVKRSKYKGWDLDEVLTRPFDKWWETHSHLFEGYYPSIIKSKNEWKDDPNFVYVRIDKTSQWTDVSNFMSEELSKVVKSDGRTRYKISGKNPRVPVLQNNYNAVVLLIKGWKPKDICTHKNNYLRKTDENFSSTRTKGERLTVPLDAKTKKPKYPVVVGKQKDMGLHHLLEVCEGRFGTVLRTNSWS